MIRKTCEMDNLCLDRIIQEYWNSTMSFETFFFDHYLLNELTKNEQW